MAIIIAKCLAQHELVKGDPTAKADASRAVVHRAYFAGEVEGGSLDLIVRDLPTPLFEPGKLYEIEIRPL